MQKAVDNYAHSSEFVPDCDKTKKICNEAPNTSRSAIRFVPACYKTPAMCDKAVFEDSFTLKYFLDRYRTQEMCDNAVDDFLPALKFVPDWFVTCKVKKIDDALFANDYVLFLDEYSGNVTFSIDKMGILREDLNNINLDDAKFYEDNAKTIIHVRSMTWHNRLKRGKVFKKDISKESMPVA